MNEKKENFGISLAMLLIIRVVISVIVNLFINNKNNIEVEMIKNYLIIGISLGISVLFIKKRQGIKFILRKFKINNVEIKIGFFSILLGIGFSLFNRWPYLVPAIAKASEKVGQGSPEEVIIILSSPFILLYISIIGPVLEEMFFRGIIQTQCQEKYGITISIIVSALIWNGFHVMWYTFFYVFPMGLILGYLYYKKKSLWIPILIHIANNTHGMINDYITMNHMTLDEIEMYFKIYKFPIWEIFMGGGIILIVYYFLILLLKNN